jgi:hypothetical protein
LILPQSGAFRKPEGGQSSGPGKSSTEPRYNGDLGSEHFH